MARRSRCLGWDPSRFSSARGVGLYDLDSEVRNKPSAILELDPPEHTRLRRLVQPGFTPKVVATYEVYCAPHDLGVGFDRVWVAADDKVLSIDLATGAATAR